MTENTYKPLTRKEMHDSAHERITLMTEELSRGFDFLRDYPKSVTMFGGSRFLEGSPYYTQARSLADKIVRELDYAVFSGGGPGIMEGANRGAFEAGGKSLGLTIKLPHEQGSNPYLTKYLDFYYFFNRKVCLSFCAEAYLFFPGGFGTMDEFFEIITLIQTNKIERVPIILVGVDFWSKVDAFIKDELLSRGSIDIKDIDLYTVTDSEEEIIKIIKEAPVRNGIRFQHREPSIPME